MPHCPWEQAPSKVAGGRMAACIDQRRYSQAILCSTLSSVTGEGDPTLSGGPRKVTGGRMAACCLPSLTLGRKDQAQDRAEENPAGTRWHKEFIKNIGSGGNCDVERRHVAAKNLKLIFCLCLNPPNASPNSSGYDSPREGIKIFSQNSINSSRSMERLKKPVHISQRCFCCFVFLVPDPCFCLLATVCILRNAVNRR